MSGVRMSRLKALPPMLSALPPLVARHTDEHGHSRTAEPWRAWYNTPRWRRLRWSVLERDNFTCRCGCGQVAKSPLLVADHVKPHRGDPALFWDPANLQTLFKPCHDGAKQRAERRMGRGV